jgi:hypothetical protein
MTCGLLFLEDGSKLISPTEVARMNLLKHGELLAGRCRIASKLCQEVNNAALLGDLLFRNIQLSNSLNETVHDGFTIHLPTVPLIRARWWLDRAAELRGSADFSVSYDVLHKRNEWSRSWRLRSDKADAIRVSRSAISIALRVIGLVDTQKQMALSRVIEKSRDAG